MLVQEGFVEKRYPVLGIPGTGEEAKAADPEDIPSEILAKLGRWFPEEE